MRVLLEPLIPRMQDAEEADVHSQRFGSRAISSSVSALSRKSKS